MNRTEQRAVLITFSKSLNESKQTNELDIIRTFLTFLP